MARHHRAPHERLTWPPPAGEDFPVVDLDGPEAPPRHVRLASDRPARLAGDSAARLATGRPARPAAPPAAPAPPWTRSKPVADIWRRLPDARVAAALLGLCLLVVLVLFLTRRGIEPSAPAPAAGAAPPVAPRTASLSVRTQPPGAEVFLDDRRLGISPVTVPAIEAGEYVVVVRHRGRAIRHTARVEAGESVSVVVPISAAAATAPAPSRAPVVAARDGSIRVVAPIELRVTQEGRLLGTSEMAKIPIGPGTHTLAFASEAAGYRTTQTVTVSAGRTTTVEVGVPDESVSINAIPWAEVIVDGRRVGETPLGTLRLVVGPHVVVLRHPRFGEKTVNTVVKAGEPARLSVDMRQ